MLGRSTAERPQRSLQPARQCGVALAAEHHLRMLPSGIGQNKVIETVREQLTGDVDAEVRHVGEVRQPLLTRRMVLTEDHFTLGPMLGAPGADATLQRAPQPMPIAMAPLHFFQHRHGAHAGTGHQQRQDVVLP